MSLWQQVMKKKFNIPNEVAKKYLDADNIVNIKNREEFELYWLASKDFRYSFNV